MYESFKNYEIWMKIEEQYIAKIKGDVFCARQHIC